MKFFLTSPLFEEHADNPGGGGGNNAPAITKADVDTAINGAVTRIEKENKALKGQIEALTAGLSTLTEKLTQQEHREPSKQDKKDDLTPEANAKISDLTKEIKNLGDRLKAAESKAETEKSERVRLAKESTVRDALSGYKFRKKTDADIAFKILNSEVEYDEDGNLIGENLPLEAFVKKAMEERFDSLIAADPAKGGASAKSGAPRSTGGFDLDKIKPGMTAEELAAASAAIADKWKTQQ